MTNEVWYINSIERGSKEITLKLISLPLEDALRKQDLYAEIGRNSLAISFVREMRKLTEFHDKTQKLRRASPLEDDLCKALESQENDLCAQSDQLIYQYSFIYGREIYVSLSPKKEYCEGQLLAKDDALKPLSVSRHL